MMTRSKTLAINSLLAPADFPLAAYNEIHRKVHPFAQSQNGVYVNYASAANALAYRFIAVTEYETSLSASLGQFGASAEAGERYHQERDLFGFFSSGFSALEAAFYCIFSLCAFVAPAAFPIQSPRDQQRVSPGTTAAAVAATFAAEPIHQTIQDTLGDASYIEWREVRNILTHRAAPGRKFYASLGGDEPLPDSWKIRDITLDASMAASRRAELSRLLFNLANSMQQFSETHL